MGLLQFAMSLLILCICLASIGVHSTCKEAERVALLNLKLSFLDNPNRLGTWVGDDCCSWKGVYCDNVTSNVFMLDLRAVDFFSPLEAFEVSPALLELKYLTYLDLSGNSFNASSIPEFIGSLEQLNYLNLSNAELSGKVPMSLGNLKQLVVLDLSNDFFGWNLLSSKSLNSQTNSLEWVSKLQNLQYLDLSGMNMSQSVDSLDILLKLPSLSVLNLASCSLESSHPVIGSSSTSTSALQHLDLSDNLFSCPFPRFIQNVSSLKYLNISMNLFSSSIPSWLGNQENLTHLDLGGNAFNDSFPSGIQNFSSISFLSLSDNQFRYSIPAWMASKTNLEYLLLGNNHFDGVDGGIMNTIGHLCNLKHLNLSYNQLQEDMSQSHGHFSRCSIYNLEFLSLRSNNFTGQLPPGIGIFSSLKHLDLSFNNLETISPSLGGLSSLVSLDLSNNNLSVVNQVHFDNLSSLKYLDLSSNNLVLNLSSDWLPPFQLNSLFLLPCKLNNLFPNWILSQKMISDLDLSDTGIFGPLPNNITNAMPSLSSLRLANNHINGSIPLSLCELASLTFLDLKKNMLSGLIPDCWANSPIIGLELSSNKLSGHIPNSLTKFGNLQMLSLNNNSLEGQLPLSLSNCAGFMVLDVGRNHLNGEIPIWSDATFPFLKILILRENRFRGIIPSQLCSVTSLQIIDLANNNLSGTIPQCFGTFEGMGSTTSLGSSHMVNATIDPNSWSAVEVIKGAEREYTTVLKLLVNMDLSSNNLVGEIPAEISNLSLLRGLNLSNNHLSGTIPKEMEMLNALESLDLSHNSISGPIPQSISSLNFLSKMNLSLNNLQGQIPTGSQLVTLDESCYMGNPGLCGDPLPKKCFGTSITAQSPTSTNLEDEDSKGEKMWLYLAIMLGFGSGFWGVIGILVVKRKWRHAYFQLAEHLAEWIYVRVAVTIASVVRNDM